MQREVKWIEDADALGEIGSSWDALARLDPTPFSYRAWFAAWWPAFGAGRTPRVCTVWDAERLVGLLPLCARDGRLEGMTNVESCVFRPLAADADALARLTAAAVSQRYDLFELRRLPEGDQGIAALQSAARDAGRLALVEPDITSPIVDTSGTLEEYRRATKSKWHKNLWRLYRKLVREHDADLRISEPPSDLAAELGEGFAVEASGWKASEGSAILSKPENEDFYTRLAELYQQRGELRISSIRIGGRMIAWDLGILHRNRLYSLKSGYLEEFKALAPGLVLELAMIERCFEEGIEAHELLGADEPYKLRFSTGARRHRAFRAFARRPVPAVRYAWRRYAPARLRRAYTDRFGPKT